ncbi:uncharacterized protein J4E84_002460 [Alternaria hordeiaustralica]|uniref:uncharacterized protein n=1 Tax=Alternaria hordeiaustralica TaxID=1187925 RepID=UPI0020C54674|nr:uncharacterized protein J4E84_002460 [Alternaria hordeiaustralica]KAI4693884.1 hypothetical protein J4E84_002460 [Alternaria hordeiaustralica]
MAPTYSMPYNPADYVASEALLPEEFFGYADIPTLVNIHEVLCNSETQDDVELATWIQERYLSAPRNASLTEPMRTAQEFSRLDRAYRRVRSLSGKTQDKWPILDLHFKEMSSAMVRNNARGEAAPGVMFPIDGLQKKACLAGQPPHGFVTPDASVGPELQVPFGTPKPSRYQPYVQTYPRPTQQTPVPLPSNVTSKSSGEPSFESQTVPSHRSQNSAASSQSNQQETHLASKSDSHAMSQTEPPPSGLPKTEEALGQTSPNDKSGAFLSNPIGGTVSRNISSNPSEDLQAESEVRDAGAGKVRGPNGRYLPKDDVEPETKKAKKPKKAVKPRTGLRNMKKQESPAPNTVGEKTETAPAEDEDLMADVQPPSPPVSSYEAEEMNGVEDVTSVNLASDIVVPSTTDLATSPTAVNEQEAEMEEEVASGSGSASAYLLAAAADPVPSNLDKLPPNSRKSIKRKSEPTATSGDRKRGKHGGIVGRPRKSEQQGSDTSDQAPVQQEDENVTRTEDPPQMVTRRATRRSAAANLNASETNKPDATSTANSPIKAPVDQPLSTSKKPSKSKRNPRKSSAPDEDEVMSGTEDRETASREETLKPTPIVREASSTPSYALGSVAPSQLPDNHFLSIGISRTSSPALHPQPSSHQPYQSPYQAVPPTPPPTVVAKTPLINGTTSTYPPGHVEYFARITTSNGSTMDLPIEESQIERKEMETIKRYAEYNAVPNAVPVLYPQFRQIWAFAKQG